MIKYKKRKGFTLIEIIIAISLISILAAVMLPKTLKISDTENTLIKNNTTVVSNLASNYEKLYSNSAISTSNLATTIYDRLKSNEQIGAMVNPYSKSNKGIGIDTTTAPNLNTGKAVYIVTSTPSNIPKGVIYYKVSIVTPTIDENITQISSTVSPDDIKLNDSIFEQEGSDAIPPSGQTSIPIKTNGYAEIWYLDQLPNVNTAAEARIMRNLNTETESHYVDKTNMVKYHSSYPNIDLNSGTTLNGNGKTITTSIAKPIFNSVKGSITTLRVISNNKSVQHILANKLVDATLLNIAISCNIDDGATISDYSNYYVAPVAYSAVSSTISNVSVTGNIIVYSGSTAAGLINIYESTGTNSNNTITGSSFTGNITCNYTDTDRANPGFTTLGTVAGILNTNKTGNFKLNITGCYVLGDINANNASGIANKLIKTNISDNIYQGNITSNSAVVGGIVGTLDATINDMTVNSSAISNKFQGTINSLSTTDTNIGGIVGKVTYYANYNISKNTSIITVNSNHVNTAYLSNHQDVTATGGIVGSFMGQGAVLSNTAKITTKGVLTNNIGGIVGTSATFLGMLSENKVESSYIQGLSNIGGIVGPLNNSLVTVPIGILLNSVSGTVIKGESYIGGIISRSNLESTASIESCTFQGTIESSNGEYVGGITSVAPTISVIDCLVKGTILTTNVEDIGGIASQIDQVINSGFDGIITANSSRYVAGVARYANIIDRSYSKGTLTAKESIKTPYGVVGGVACDITQYIRRSFSTMTIKTDAVAVGGVLADTSIGEFSQNGVPTNCYYTGTLDLSNKNVVAYGVGNSAKTSYAVVNYPTINNANTYGVSRRTPENSHYWSPNSTGTGLGYISYDSLRNLADPSWDFTSTWTYKLTTSYPQLIDNEQYR